MPKLVISVDGVVVKEAQLTKDRTTLGRRPYNDIVIDHLAVSGEHAVILMQNGDVILQDCHSTNGTYVNGARVNSHVLADKDRIEIGRHRIVYRAQDDAPAAAAAARQTQPGVQFQESRPAPIGKAGPRVRVLNGSATGREMPLIKEATTIGKPGVAVASITRKAQGFELTLVEGSYVPTVNGVPLDKGPIMLRNHDRIELAGIRMEFIDG